MGAHDDISLQSSLSWLSVMQIYIYIIFLHTKQQQITKKKIALCLVNQGNLFWCYYYSMKPVIGVRCIQSYGGHTNSMVETECAPFKPFSTLLDGSYQINWNAREIHTHIFANEDRIATTSFPISLLFSSNSDAASWVESTIEIVLHWVMGV